MPSSVDVWKPKRRIEDQYRKSLYELVDFFLQGLEGVDLANPARVLDLFQQFASSAVFQTYTTILASRMVSGQAVEGAKSWREAARISLKGRQIFEGLRKEMQGPVGKRVEELVNENAKLISTFPESISQQVANYIQRQQLKGERPESISSALLKEFPSITKPRLNLIARTECAKASTALVQAQAEDVELNYYVWRTSKDARVRHSHRRMEGIICSWSEAPSPETLFPENGVKAVGAYPPGGIYNCRCYPQVLVKTDQVEWPHRIFLNGSVRQYTRAGFERLI